MENLKYAKTHEWFHPNTQKVGISSFAVSHLGDVVEVELPEEGEQVEKGQEIGTVESTKTASPLYAPLSGTIVTINEEIEDAPELVNDSPFEEGWLFVLKPSSEEEITELLSPDAYKAHCAEEEE